ncbi:MAG: PQQ-binding-like beta-propeller repeat protein, partial [Chloroflexota bacterium]
DTASVENPAGIELSNGVLAEIVVTDDFIYVPYRQQDVVALDRETYEEVWRFDTQEGVWAQPLLNDGVLYVTSVDHFVYALDANTGEELWRVDLEGAVTSTPLLYENHLYVGSYSHKIYQISLDGTIAAEYEGTNWVWGTPVIQDNVLYYSDLSGYVYALDANGLTEIWAERPSRKGIRPAPIVTDQYVVVAGRDGSVYWLNIDSGSTVQTAELDNRPELLSDMLYIPADEENGLPELVLVASTENNRLVTALNMETFTPQWVYSR